MELERQGHEILSVETVETGTQTATVRRQHTMFAHVILTAPATVVVGVDLTLQADMVRWDDRAPITDEERDLVVRIEGQQVAAVSTAGGTVSVPLRFDAAGTYQVTVTGDLVVGASLEVTVA